MNRGPQVQGQTLLEITPRRVRIDFGVDSSTWIAASRPFFLPPCTLGVARVMDINSAGADVKLYDEFASDRLLNLIAARTTTGVIAVYATIAANKTRPIFLAGWYQFYMGGSASGESMRFELELIPGIRFRRYE